jgi:cell division septum initiation protein DivIVA
MTASEIYLECEKEQEGIVRCFRLLQNRGTPLTIRQVNRLTRELSLLRQQTASVVSNTSSTTSELVSDYSNIVPTSARRHRSSSNLSTRSTRSINAATANATSVSAVAPARETSVPSSSRPSMDIARPDLNRQDSATGRRSVTASPSLSSSHTAFGASFGQTQSHQTPSHRQSSSSQPATQVPAIDSHAHHARSPSFSAAVAAARYEEAAFHRAELESVKRENEALRQRIRDLERSLAGRSAVGESAGQSTTTTAVDQ